jgi:DNA polymerase-3 subunit delta'
LTGKRAAAEPRAERPPPRLGPPLLGHEAAAAQMAEAARSGRIAHAWLIEGPRGIGKATLAYRFARYLLAGGPGQGGGLFGETAPTLDVAEDSRAARLVAAGSHPDLLTLERSWDEKAKRLRKVISAEEARSVADFMHLTPAEGGWRVAVVDAVDDLNPTSMNALLKILEEPPKRAVLLLVYHGAGRILPTIRSRCRRLKLKPLEPGVLDRLLATHAPDLPAEERGPLAQLARGSLARALDLIEAGGLGLYRQLFQLASAAPVDVPQLHGFADKLARKDAEASYLAAVDMHVDLLARLARAAADPRPPSEVVPGEAVALRRLAGRRSLDRWRELWENSRRLVQRSEAVNIDRKQVLLTLFLALDDDRLIAQF